MIRTVFFILFAFFYVVVYPLDISCVSMQVSGNADSDLNTVKTLLARAAGDLVIFPELALCNRSSGKDKAWVDNAVQELRTMCSQQQKALVAGTVRYDGNAVYNAALIINSSGVLVGTYDQIHVADTGFSPGMAVPHFTVATSGGSIVTGVQIGNDLYFPEPWQYFAEQGVRAALLVHLSGFSGTETWKREMHDDLLMAKSADNTCFAAGVSLAGSASLMSSQILDGVGNVITRRLPATPGIENGTVNLASPGFSMFQRHDEWRTDLYELVIKDPVRTVLNSGGAVPGPEIQVWPNPFRTSVGIQVLVRNDECGMQNIRLGIYDIKGRQIARFDKFRIPHSAFRILYSWSASGHPAGIYTLVVNTGKSKLVKRVTLLK
jgi:predicted amidohydrolase